MQPQHPPIREKERAAILGSLAAGVVPAIGLQHVQVGRKAEVSAILVYSGSRAQALAAPVPGAASASPGNTEVLGWLLYTDYLVPFEVASVLLLVAMVGAILLARREA